MSIVEQIKGLWQRWARKTSQSALEADITVFLKRHPTLNSLAGVELLMQHMNDQLPSEPNVAMRRREILPCRHDNALAMVQSFEQYMRHIDHGESIPRNLVPSDVLYVLLDDFLTDDKNREVQIRFIYRSLVGVLTRMIEAFGQMEADEDDRLSHYRLRLEPLLEDAVTTLRLCLYLR